MRQSSRRVVRTIAIVLACLVPVSAVAFFWFAGEEESWTSDAEGFLAVPTPCCSEALLWDTLDEVTEDGQRPRPANAAEAAVWQDTWPYRGRDEQGRGSENTLHVAVQSSELRCVGINDASQPPPPSSGEDALSLVRTRPGCEYVKWKIWSGGTAERRPNERHAIWADSEGNFHGRVDFWR